MSCIVMDVPVPTLLLSTPSFANDLHSGPSAAPFSVITNPQVLHANSPEFWSKTSDALLQDGQRCLSSLGIILIVYNLAY